MTEQTYLGSNINLVKAHNLQAILLSLLHEGSLSRVQLARKTHLSTTTITNLIAELLEQGIVTEEEPTDSSEPRPVGRPRTGLRLVPNARFAVGVHIGIGLYRIAICNLYAEMLHNQIETFDLDTPAEAVLEQMSARIQELIHTSGIDPRRIIGVGVGASGLVNYQNGVNILAPNLGWREVPIRSYLQARLNLPVTVDNNVRAMALGEAYFGVGRGVDSLVFVYGRTGVGAGLVVSGQVFRGSSTGAGEIGHMIIVPENGAPCRCGNRGCLETLIAEPVILRQAQAIADQEPDRLLAQYLRQPGNDSPIERVFEAARRGDPSARQLLDQAAHYLGLALANLVNVLNPELILLGGMLAQGQDLILPTAERTMRSMAFAGMGEKVRLQITSFGWRAGVIGAASLALTRFFYQQAQPAHQQSTQAAYNPMSAN
jgi:glucokinase-like ROK family protein